MTGPELIRLGHREMVVDGVRAMQVLLVKNEGTRLKADEAQRRIAGSITEESLPILRGVILPDSASKHGAAQSRVNDHTFADARHHAQSQDLTLLEVEALHQICRCGDFHHSFQSLKTGGDHRPLRGYCSIVCEIIKRQSIY